MKRKLVVLICLMYHLIAIGQTNKLIQIAGTKCSLIPPSGFVLASKFTGLQHAETGASIMIIELPTAYQTIADGFTKEALATKGITLIQSETINYNGSKALLMLLNQNANGMLYVKQILVFGDSANTVMVNGVYPAQFTELETPIKTALLTTTYNYAQVENPIEAANFSINVANSDFKIAKYIAGGLLYTVDGKIPTTKPTLIVSNSVAPVDLHNQQKYAEDRLKKMPNGDSYLIKNSKPITINKLNGIEIIAVNNTNAKQPELLYQTILFGNDGYYYVIVGKAKEELTKYETLFKKIATTFKLK